MLINLKKYNYIYLHGFASGPKSSKAQYFKNKFLEHGINLHLPDLNQNDFSNLTISRQLTQVQEIINSCNKPVILIGSSMGGLLSTMLAETNSMIDQIILLAPAFKMSQLWVDGVTKEQLDDWKSQGQADIFHYEYEKKIPLKYNFYLDLFKHNDAIFKRQLPTLIFHGEHDDVVPIKLSNEYLKENPIANLVKLMDDHSLTKDLNFLWTKTVDFIV